MAGGGARGNHPKTMRKLLGAAPTRDAQRRHARPYMTKAETTTTAMRRMAGKTTVKALSGREPGQRHDAAHASERSPRPRHVPATDNAVTQPDNVALRQEGR